MAELIAIVLAAGWCVSLLACAALIRGERREAARERNLMLNQIMHLAGRTWQPPPADDPGFVPPPAEFAEFVRPSQHLSL